MVDAGEYMVQCLCWYEDEEKGIWMIKWMEKWMMDMAWFCMRFRRILGIYHPCQFKDR